MTLGQYLAEEKDRIDEEVKEETPTIKSPYWCDDPRCTGFNRWHDSGLCDGRDLTDGEIDDILEKYNRIVRVMEGGE